jgi:dienelactone hydrolase
MNTPSFRLQSHVDYLYANKPRRLAFEARTPDEFKVWQQSLRGEIVDLLGLNGRTPPPDPSAEKLQVINRGKYVEELYALDVGEGVTANMYVLVPKAPPPYKAIMAFHGHNPSVQYILGNFPDDQAAQQGRAIDDNFAQALAESGYLVCAVEQRGFGERLTNQLIRERSCRHLSFEYMLQGRTLVGERCWDGMCAISYVQNRSDIVPGVLGCTGHSGGGTTTLWLTAIEPRITAAVVSCYFCSFKASILGMEHCECNYVPGILELAEMGDLAALLAPRPLRFINGEQDPIFPIGAVREQYETVKRAYALMNVSDKLSLSVHSGAHAYNHAYSREWFGWWL